MDLLIQGEHIEDALAAAKYLRYQPLPGENLQFSTRPNKTASFDWSYWVKIEVK